MKIASALRAVLFAGAISQCGASAHAKNPQMPLSKQASVPNKAAHYKMPAKVKPSSSTSDMPANSNRKIQEQMDRQSKASTTASNVLKKSSNTATGTTNNLK